MSYEINSKRIKKGDIFVAIKGQYYDGHDYINEAIRNGAIKIIGEKPIEDVNIPYKKVKSTKKYLTKVIGKENKQLSRNFTIIGITGTKGKTTTSMLVYQLLQKLNIKAAYVGTLGLYFNEKNYSLNNTTPDIITINHILKILKEENISHIVMEVSSHALIEKRINGLKFNIAAFTNLSQDHLDYHKTMKNYLKAKLKILDYLKGPIILNKDAHCYQYFQKRSHNSFVIGKDIIITSYTLNQSNSIINFEYLYNAYNVYIPFTGKYNIYNYLMAISILIQLGIDIEDIINNTNSLKPIPGRGELIKTKNAFIIIDYAHSPGSVESILKTYNELKKGKIYTIIGCGGNRDKTKRPIMANIATDYSHYAIFTSDNPRDENPKTIINDMVKDLKNNNYEVIINRSKAIKKGIKLLKKNDYLLILGKGHETYQIIGNKKLPFDDKKEVMKYL